MEKRSKEENELRERLKNCERKRKKEKGIIDVKVRDIGSIIEKKLKGEW